MLIQTQINVLINLPHDVRYNPFIVTKVRYHVFPLIKSLKDKKACQSNNLNAR